MNGMHFPKDKHMQVLIENLIYRNERAEDWRAAETVTRDAFWDTYKPGCDEHYLLHEMRSRPGFVPELAYVAELGGVKDTPLAGASYCTRAAVVDGTASREVLCLGPIAVRPDLQRRGIGRALLSLTIARSRELGFAAIFLYGDPGYYSASGFLPASDFDVHPAEGGDTPAFMIHPIDPVATAALRGRFIDDPVFHFDSAEADAFDRLFPPRERHRLPGQLFG
jgi:predicted N-acetyltransferase YhbS